jgi:adenylate cyclase
MTHVLGEQRAAELIGALFRRCGEIIRERASRMEKYMGDGLMAAWFHDEPDDHPLRPFEALRDIHHETAELNRRFTLPFPLRIGAGLNTGYAMVGSTGRGEGADYTALGDTVNAAFRLESATKDINCDLVIGEGTYQRLLQTCGVSGPFARCEAHLKGFGPTTVYSCSFADLEAFLARKPVQA